MKKNKFTLFASFLDRNLICSKKKSFHSAEEKEEYDKLAFFWDKCLPEETEKMDVWSKTQQKIVKDSTPITLTSKRKEQKFWIRMLKYSLTAASIALLIGIAYLVKSDEKRSNLMEIAQSMQPNATQESKEVTLIVSNEKKIELANNVRVEYTTTGQLQVNSAQVDESGSKEAYNQLIVPKGKRSMIVLSDNSKIWINSDSKIVYPRSFKGKYREIFVEGEIYLDVAHNAEKPFIVNTSGFEVRVLGTSFNVSAYKNRKASVVLVEGSVNVKDQHDGSLKMIPNEKVNLNQTGIINKEKVNVSDYVSWINGIWILEGQPLKNVLQHLEEYYGEEIECASAIENELIYGKLYLNEDMNKVLNSIAATVPIQYSTRDHTIYVEHKR